MKFFKLRLSSDPRILGVKNGLAQLVFDQSAYSERELDRIDKYFLDLSWWNNMPTPDFEQMFYFNALKGARSTNFLKFDPFFNACPFVIQDDVRVFLEKFNLGDFKLFPAQIKNLKGGEDTGHWVLFTQVLDFDVIDFAKTVFYRGSLLTGKTYFSFDSYEEWKKVASQVPVHEEEIGMTTQFNPMIDLFQSRIGGLFISEKLKTALEKERFTGINYDMREDPRILY